MCYGWKKHFEMKLIKIQMKTNVTKNRYFNPLTPGTFCQNCFFFDILVVLKLDRGQISFRLVENTLVARQLAVLATKIAFKTF